MASYDYTWKIMMLGDKEVDKTSLTIRYISGFFLDDLKLTIGVDFYSKTTNYNDKKVKLQIWDFGGEERFRFLLHQYCKGANAAFYLYNITIPRTFEHLQEWLEIIREHAGDIPIMLVGTNMDLQEKRAITREQAIQAAKKYNLSSFIEVSAKTGQNVEKLFEVITELLFNRYSPEVDCGFVSYPTYKTSKSSFPKSKKGSSQNNSREDISFNFKSFLKVFSEWIVEKIERIVKVIKSFLSRVI